MRATLAFNGLIENAIFQSSALCGYGFENVGNTFQEKLNRLPKKLRSLANL